MRVVHEPADGGTETVLATTVETAESLGEQARGLMGRRSLPDSYALVFEFPEPPWVLPAPLTHWRSIHMLFVRVPLDVLWVREETVQKTKTVEPWTGVGLGRADTVIELPAGAASEVAPGDTVEVRE